MQYNYRWWYAIALCLSLMWTGCHYVVKPVFIRVAKQQIAEKQLIDSVAVLEGRLSHQASALPLKPTSQTEELNELTGVAHLSGVTMQSVTFRSVTSLSSESRMMHLVVQGDAQAMMSWLFNVTSERQHHVLLHFSWQTAAANQQRISMDLLMLNAGWPFQHVVWQPVIMQNPFCLTKQTTFFLAENDHDQRLSISLYQMKMIGYLQQGPYHQALIALPINTVIAVDVGVTLGLEQGIVTAINQESVQLRLPNQSSMMLSMQH